MPKDYYRILGVEHTASAEDIKRAYRSLAHRHHPDKGGDQEKFKEVNAAYQVLSDPAKRQQYDQFGHAFEGEGIGGQETRGFDPFGVRGSNVRFEDLGGFGDMFSRFFGGAASSPEQHVGDDLAVQVVIPFTEMAFGAKREFPLNRNRPCPRCHGNLAEPETKIVTCGTCHGRGVRERKSQTFLGTFMQQSICPTCHGEGKTAQTPCRECRGEGRTRRVETLVVTIPPGIESGTRLRIAGEGEAAPYGGSPGDLYVLVKVHHHPRFRRDGNDIMSEVQVPFTVAALGGEVRVETIDGEVPLAIPRGTASGVELHIKGKGIVVGRYGDTGKRGDHRVTVVIAVPKKLTKEQEALLQKFGETSAKKGFRFF